MTSFTISSSPTIRPALMTRMPSTLGRPSHVCSICALTCLIELDERIESTAGSWWSDGHLMASRTKPGRSSPVAIAAFDLCSSWVATGRWARLCGRAGLSWASPSTMSVAETKQAEVYACLDPDLT